MINPVNKYKAYTPIQLPDRTWPGTSITQPPTWCSVDLRDGNQSLKIPMNPDDKLLFFNLLLAIGLKEIEVGFPSASNSEFEFIRNLIEGELIPEDATIQVLTQSKPALIEKTFESIQGAKRVIYHLYNSTSSLQRNIVFKADKKDIIKLAVDGAVQIGEMAASIKETDFIFQYSPESFTGTELDFSLEVCEAVMDAWQPYTENKVILNLPATVEMSTPNIYADMIEWFCRSFSRPGQAIISVHTHNDRGTGVAATELALMAGAERVEGTLFGCGERTGNVDLMNLALNLFSQGIDPKLDFSDINRIASIYEKCTGMIVHPRHPYAGELVYTAFSGSHQDAIKKGMDYTESGESRIWSVPYLPIDPQDVGRNYEKIIRINSQSGKGGVAYIMESKFGIRLPKSMHVEFGKVIQQEAENTGVDVNPERMLELFNQEYTDRFNPLEFLDCEIRTRGDSTRVIARINLRGTMHKIEGVGNGPLDALGTAIKRQLTTDFKLTSYSEHALDETTASQAIAYIELEASGSAFFGVGIDANISIASFKALFSALNRAAGVKDNVLPGENSEKTVQEGSVGVRECSISSKRAEV
ncbi:MAG: 2-isopropylmalate synthase [Proteobacteria bacterium]|nr:2-isopropylmalate synthase [Pseudomonadota bacterium]